MHEEMMKDPSVVRCIGKWEEFTIYEVSRGFLLTDDKGISRGSWFKMLLKQEHWEKGIKEIRAAKDVPKKIFLLDYQVEELLKWASITPLDDLQSMTCRDCKDTGWYVGLIERYPCPTCKGKTR